MYSVQLVLFTLKKIIFVLGKYQIILSVFDDPVTACIVFVKNQFINPLLIYSTKSTEEKTVW